MDLCQQLVTLDGQTVTLTRMEYRLLALFVRHGGEVVPRATIMMRVWGYIPETHTRTLDVHIRKLRKKLRMRAGQYIEAVVGVEYRFRPPALPQRLGLPTKVDGQRLVCKIKQRNRQKWRRGEHRPERQRNTTAAATLFPPSSVSLRFSPQLDNIMSRYWEPAARRGKVVIKDNWKLQVY